VAGYVSRIVITFYLVDVSIGLYPSCHVAREVQYGSQETFAEA
jgi:hypothetical protein